MFYPAEGEFMQLLGLPPVNLQDSNLHVCELLEINYRTPVGDKWVVVENIEVDANLQDFLMLKGEAASGKSMRRIFIRMKRVRDRHNQEKTVEEWSIRFGARIVKPLESLERAEPRDSLRLLRRGVTGWLLLTWVALVAGTIGTKGVLLQVLVTGAVLGAAHAAQAKANEYNRRIARRGLWMVILALLVMLYAPFFGLQRFVT